MIGSLLRKARRWEVCPLDRDFQCVPPGTHALLAFLSFFLAPSPAEIARTEPPATIAVVDFCLLSLLMFMVRLIPSSFSCRLLHQLKLPRQSHQRSLFRLERHHRSRRQQRQRGACIAPDSRCPRRRWSRPPAASAAPPVLCSQRKFHLLHLSQVESQRHRHA